MTGGEDPTQLTAVESFLRKGSSNRLSDTSSACSLGELQSWILIFERNLERCPSPGANDLYQCFVNGIPFNELTVKASIYERIVAELGTRAASGTSRDKFSRVTLRGRPSRSWQERQR